MQQNFQFCHILLYSNILKLLRLCHVLLIAGRGHAGVFPEYLRKIIGIFISETAGDFRHHQFFFLQKAAGIFDFRTVYEIDKALPVLPLKDGG